MSAEPSRFQRALALIDAANAADPREELTAEGERHPREALYARRMTEMLERYAPQADEALRLAARAQHIERWKTPRASYPAGRAGYLQWRAGLYRFHADTAGRLLEQAGYDAATIERVRQAIGKKGLQSNPDTQRLEDVASLVFIEHYMAPFAGQKRDYSDEKWRDITRKIWRKMSPEARAFVLSGRIDTPPALRPLLEQAARELLPSGESTALGGHHAGKAEGH
jgi:hypothetical protein